MATLSGNKIKDTYQSLVKFSDNGNITTSAKQLTDGFGNNSPMFVSTTQVGIGVTPESGLNLHVFGDAKIGSNLTVIGNLVVEGSTTTVGTDTLTVKDPLIVLANNNTSTDAVDIGFYGKYTPSGTTLYSGLFREALTGKYRLFKGLEVEPTTTVNTSGTGYAVASLVANLEGNVTGGTISGTTGTFSGDVNVNSNLIVTTGTPISGQPNGSNIIAKIDSSAGTDSGGLEIHTGDNNGDEPALLHTNYNGDEAFRISSLGHIISTGNGTFTGSLSASFFKGDVYANDGTSKILENGTDGTDATFTGDVTGDVTGNVTGGTISGTTGDFSGNVDIDGTLDVDDVISVEGSAFGRIEIGGASGGYVDLKAPNSDDYDLRLITSVGGAELLSIDTLKFYTGATTDLAFTIDASQNATFENNVTIPETPTADTHAASKGYVDAAVEGQDTLAEILAIGNTTGGTDIAVSVGDDILLTDTSELKLGTDADFKIYHDGSNAWADNHTGSFYLTTYSDDKDIIFRTDDGSGGVANYMRIDGSSEEVLFLRKTRHNDNITADFGTDRDLQIYHDGSDSYIKDSGTGNLKVLTNSIEIKNAAGTKNLIVGEETTGVELYAYNNSTNALKKVFYTQDAGSGFPASFFEEQLYINSGTGSGSTFGSLQYYTEGSGNERGGINIRGGNGIIGLRMFIGTAWIQSLPDAGALSSVVEFFPSNNPTTAIAKYQFTSGDAYFGNSSADVDVNIKGALDVTENATFGGDATFAGDVTVNNSGDGKITVGGTSGLEIIHNNAGNTIAEIKQLYASTSNSAQMKLTSGFTTLHTGTAGAERMRIDSSGNVGIGTTSPDAKLTLKAGDNTYAGGFRIEGTDETTALGITHVNGDNYFSGNATDDHLILTGTGNVGIGTDNPQSKLHVKSSESGASAPWTNADNLVIEDSGNAGLAFQTPNTGAATIAFQDPESVQAGFIQYLHADNALRFATNGNNERMRIDSSGNVTIGTGIIKPAIGGDIAITQGAIGLRINDAASAISPTTATSNNDNAVDLGVSNIRFRNLYMGGTGTFGGNVGINDTISGNFTTNYDTKLLVGGEIIARSLTASASMISIGGDATSAFIKVGKQDGSQTARPFRIEVGTSEVMNIDSSGNVGIGTEQTSFNPNSKLQIARGDSPSYIQFISGNLQEQGILFGDPEDTVEGSIRYAHDGDYMWFQVNNAERMRITSGGDLHVDGDVVAYSTTISDKRLKDNVKPLESSLDKVMNLKGVEYVWNNGSRKGQKDIGFIAQEVEDVIPEIVREKQVIFNKEEKYKTVDYEKITAVLVEAVKELTAKVKRLENNKCNCK